MKSKLLIVFGIIVTMIGLGLFLFYSENIEDVCVEGKNPDGSCKGPTKILVVSNYPIEQLEEYSVKELLENTDLIPIRFSNDHLISLISDKVKSEYACASLSLDRLPLDQLQYYVKPNQTNPKFFSITDKELDTHPELKLLIAASNLIEFPYDDSIRFYFDGVDFVEYEFFLVDKAIEKYGGVRNDFITLDSDYEKILTNPKKQGFENRFEAPQIIYNGKIYRIGGTIFWTSDETNLDMSLQLRDSVDEEKKFIELSDEDMKKIPKIKDAIDGMGKVQEKVYASIGMVENPDWINYSDWYGDKITANMEDDQDHENAFSGFTYDDQFYELSFPIC